MTPRPSLVASTSISSTAPTGRHNRSECHDSEQRPRQHRRLRPGDQGPWHRYRPELRRQSGHTDECASDRRPYTGNQTGIRVGEPGKANTSPTGVLIDGVTVNNSVDTGIDIQGGVSTITNSHLANNLTGIHVTAGKATIINNPTTISGGSVGIDVDGGTALVQTTNITGSRIGVRIQNGGIADLGQNGPGINYTGLGVSTGGNNFSSYTAAATSTSGAIVNLNTGGAYSNAGPQGYAGAAKDVAAFNNLWNEPVSHRHRERHLARRR